MNEPKPQLEYELLSPGEVYGPVSMTVDEDRVKLYAFAIDDYSPPYFVPQGVEVAPPLVLANDLIALHYLKYERPRRQSIQMKQDYRFLRLPRVGEPLTLQATLVEKYEKRGIRRMVIGTTVTDAQGSVLLDGAHTFGWPSPDRFEKPSTPSAAAPSSGASAVGTPRSSDPDPVRTGRSEAGAAQRGAGDLGVGRVLGPLRKVLTQERITAFTGPTKLTSIHTNPEVAKAAGLPGTVAQGLQSAGFIWQLMTRTFGRGFYEAGSMSLAFVGLMHVNDVIEVGGRITDIEDEGAETQLYTVDIWCTRQDGAKTTVGTAKARSAGPA